MGHLEYDLQEFLLSRQNAYVCNDNPAEEIEKILEPICDKKTIDIVKDAMFKMLYIQHRNSFLDGSKLSACPYRT